MADRWGTWGSISVPPTTNRVETKQGSRRCAPACSDGECVLSWAIAGVPVLSCLALVWTLFSAFWLATIACSGTRCVDSLAGKRVAQGSKTTACIDRLARSVCAGLANGLQFASFTRHMQLLGTLVRSSPALASSLLAHRDFSPDSGDSTGSLLKAAIAAECIAAAVKQETALVRELAQSPGEQHAHDSPGGQTSPQDLAAGWLRTCLPRRLDKVGPALLDMRACLLWCCRACHSLGASTEPS